VGHKSGYLCQWHWSVGSLELLHYTLKGRCRHPPRLAATSPTSLICGKPNRNLAGDRHSNS
jgi:hypothetical protein